MHGMTGSHCIYCTDDIIIVFKYLCVYWIGELTDTQELLYGGGKNIYECMLLSQFLM